MKSNADERPLAILSAPGSRGDVNPMVAIGAALRDRGYDVAISLAEPYAGVATAAGLTPYPLISREQFDSLMEDPSVWKLVRGMRKVIQGVAANFLRPHFDLIQSLHRPGNTVLVSHPLDFASRIFRDVDPTTPLVDVHLAPVMLRTREDPAHLTPWRFEPTRNRTTFRLAYWLGDALVLDRLLARPINQIRRERGLPAVRRIMNQWWLSPDRVLALYPEWFAPATARLMNQLAHVGFPLSDGVASDGVASDGVTSDGVAGGGDQKFEPPRDRPIVFTGGTANRHSKAFFSQAVRACESLGLPGLLLSGHPECFPDRLPDTVRPQGYVPFGKLLPHCSAVVHHGGVGTTSQALRAGIAQLVRPMAFDQFDNAARVERLGCGLVLRNDGELLDRLRALTSNSDFQTAANQISLRFAEQRISAAELAAEEVERQLAKSRD